MGKSVPEYKDPVGRYFTEGLFWETSRNREKYPPVFTLKDKEHQGCPSLKEQYMLAEDPTEYFFATTVLGSVEHWEQLCRCTWFKPHVTQWRKELDALLRAKAVEIAKQIMTTDERGSTRLSAAKFIVERAWEQKGAKGRPKKADVERAAKELAESNLVLEEDWTRISDKLGVN